MFEFTIDPEKIGARVRALRQKQNKSQNYFADMLYISPSYLALIEAGKRVPGLETLVHLSRLTDVSIDYLIFGEDKKMDQNRKMFERLANTYSEDEIKRALKVMEYGLKVSRLPNPDDEIK